MSSEIDLRAILDSCPDGVIVKDMNGKILYTNRAAGELFGCFDPGRVPEELGEVLRVGNKEVNSGRDRVKARIAGKEVYLDLLRYPVPGNDGKVANICCFFAMERAFPGKEDMDHMTLREISHEFKTPLSILNMAREMCERASAQNDHGKVLKSQLIAKKNIARLTKDITNLLHLFKLDVSGEPGIENEVISLGSMVDSVIRDLSVSWERENVKINVNIHPGVDKIYGEKQAIHGLIYNLADNSMKFTKEGSIDIEAFSDGKWAVLKIIDTGAGIAPDKIVSVFKRFAQDHTSTEGTGIGLPICKKIVEKYKGTIEIFSEGINKGTTVIVKFPASVLVQ
ncbi:MAG: PAS domain-containing protein [Candidatus Omnitrophica bacterium]|nr:PAS domain-containing protein [Candidatus Omnitrophota bacterium]